MRRPSRHTRSAMPVSSFCIKGRNILADMPERLLPMRLQCYAAPANHHQLHQLAMYSGKIAIVEPRTQEHCIGLVKPLGQVSQQGSKAVHFWQRTASETGANMCYKGLKISQFSHICSSICVTTTGNTNCLRALSNIVAHFFDAASDKFRTRQFAAPHVSHSNLHAPPECNSQQFSLWWV